MSNSFLIPTILVAIGSCGALLSAIIAVSSYGRYRESASKLTLRKDDKIYTVRAADLRDVERALDRLLSAGIVGSIIPTPPRETPLVPDADGPASLVERPGEIGEEPVSD